MSSSDNKWTCSKCTYENWPRAARCTLCAGARPKRPSGAPLIEDAEPRALTPPPASAYIHQLQQDSTTTTNSCCVVSPSAATAGSRLQRTGRTTPGGQHCNGGGGANNILNSPAIGTPLVTSPTHGGLGSQSAPAAEWSRSASPLSCSLPGGSAPSWSPQKWSCPKCTYLNWPKSARCVQCATGRPSLSAGVPLSPDSTVTTATTGGTAPTLTLSPSATTSLLVLPRSASPPLPAALSRASPEASTSCSCSSSSSSVCSSSSHTVSSAHHQSQQLSYTSHTPSINASSAGSYPVLSLSTTSAPSPVLNSLAGEHAGGAGIGDPTLGNSGFNVGSELQQQQKWSCSMCTYANWPKSQRCVMCHTSRLSSTAYNNNINNNNNNNNMHNNNNSNNNNHHLNNSNKAAAGGCGSGVGSSGGTGGHHSSGLQSGSPFGSSLAIARACSPPVIIDTAGGAVATGCYSENEDADSNNYLSTLRSSKRQQSKQLKTSAGGALSSSDRLWLNACLGVIEGDLEPVLHYIESGMDLFRTLTNLDVQHLHRARSQIHRQIPGSLYYVEPGLSLMYLCVKLHRDDILTQLLAASDSMGAVVPKRVPSDACPETAADIRRHVAASFKQRKGTEFACYFVTDNVTFALPSEIEHLHSSVQKILFDELLDRDAQKELEEESPIINWSLELTQRFGSRLYALWNRSAGDCLLDSVLQATWGVFDRDNTLRRILADSLCDAASLLYPRWKEAEAWQANLQHYSLAEAQWQEDWAMLVSLASQPGAALEQLHIFTLAHVFRRPIIVYGVKCIKSFRGEDLGLARFEGIYLPLLWECPSFCWKSPIALGYTRGHFSALVPMEPPDVDLIAGGPGGRRVGCGGGTHSPTGGCGGGGAHSQQQQPHRQDDIIYLPLMSADLKLLPIHFLKQNEMGREEEFIREWLDYRLTESGLLVALQRLQTPLRRPTLVTQMLDEWLQVYRTLSLRKNSANSRLNQFLLTMAAEEHSREQQQQQQDRSRSPSTTAAGVGTATTAAVEISLQQQQQQRQRHQRSCDERSEAITNEFE